jgi:hypothetical protein
MLVYQAARLDDRIVYVTFIAQSMIGLLSELPKSSEPRPSGSGFFKRILQFDGSLPDPRSSSVTSRPTNPTTHPHVLLHLLKYFPTYVVWWDLRYQTNQSFYGKLKSLSVLRLNLL